MFIYFDFDAYVFYCIVLQEELSGVYFGVAHRVVNQEGYSSASVLCWSVFADERVVLELKWFRGVLQLCLL